MIRLNSNVNWDIFDYKELEKHGIEYTFNDKPRNKDNKIYGYGYISKPVHGRRKNSSYQKWCKILRNCYADVKEEDRRTICDEWLDYIVFEDWYNQNYYEIEGEEVILMCNIIQFDNIHYSPETSIFVPRGIVNAIKPKNFKTKKRDDVGRELPMGITYRSGKYYAHGTYNNEKISIGSSCDLKELIPLVKMIKKKEMQRIISEYKEKIPENVQQQLYSVVEKYDYDSYFSIEREGGNE